MSFQATAELETEVNELISHYPVKRAASLMVLHAIQEKFGWISQEAVMWTAKKLELAPINIFEILTFYPVKRAASLMVLHAIQEKFGWISQEAVMWTAKKLELAPINIFEILTFYPMLRQQPMGKYQIKVCRPLSCALGGSYKL